MHARGDLALLRKRVRELEEISQTVPDGVYSPDDLKVAVKAIL
jgi:hypothetical protein